VYILGCTGVEQSPDLVRGETEETDFRRAWGLCTPKETPVTEVWVPGRPRSRETGVTESALVISSGSMKSTTLSASTWGNRTVDVVLCVQLTLEGVCFVYARSPYGQGT